MQLMNGSAGMAQIFSPAADTWLRLFLLGGLAIVAGGTAGIVGFARSGYVTSTDFRPSAAGAVQPPASCRRARDRLPLLPQRRGDRPQAGLPPTADLHDLPFPDLDQCRRCWSRSGKALPMTSRSMDARREAAGLCLSSVTTFTSPRASAAKPAMAASIRWR